MENMNDLEIEMAFAPSADDLLTFSNVEEDKPEEGYIIITDGLCEPNPHGIGTWAVVIFCPHGNLLEQHFDDIGSGEHVTNNVAEYVAVINALIWTVECAPDEPVEIRTDSQLVANQINGKWACNKQHLRELRDDAVELLRQSNAVIRWVPKAETQVADLLTKLAYIKAKREQDEGDND
jgi:ribonuclease HI